MRLFARKLCLLSPCAAFALATLGALPVHASLIGASVTGSMTFPPNTNNFYDPAFNQVPPTALNFAGTTVIIANPAVEFDYLSQDGEFSSNFGATALTFTALFNFHGPIHLTFKSAAFVGLDFNEVSDALPNGGVTGSLTGDTITLDWAGNSVFGTTTKSAVYSLLPNTSSGNGSSVPLPSGAGAGIVGVATALTLACMSRSRPCKGG